MKPVFWGLMSLVLFLGATQECKADYIFTTLDVPGATSTGASGINDLGQIVGGYSNPDTTVHGFLLSSGGYTTLDVPGALGTLPLGINDLGQIVGTYSNDGPGPSRIHGFLLSDGGYTTIDVPGSTLTRAYGINNSGQIVGEYMDAGFKSHGFLATPVSEPSAALLLSIGMIAVLGYGWRRVDSKEKV